MEGPNKALESGAALTYDEGFALRLSRLLVSDFSIICEIPSMRDPIQDGINFFNSGRYFEAHESWEDAWRSTRGPLRLFYQGLIQAAVGLHHLCQGNANGAAAQLQKSIAKLEQYPHRFCRIDNRKLVEDLGAVLLEMRAQPIRIERV